MPSFLNQIRTGIQKGFKGKLRTGTLRQRTPSGVANSKGDPTSFTYTTLSVDCFVEEYSTFYKQQAGIPETDVKVVVIGGSLGAVRPKKSDEIQIEGRWYRVRRPTTDPAEATWMLQSFEIADPT